METGENWAGARSRCVYRGEFDLCANSTYYETRGRLDADIEHAYSHCCRVYVYVPGTNQP